MSKPNASGVRVPEGWRLVPPEPTLAMFRAQVEWALDDGEPEVSDEFLQANLDDFKKGYVAMLAAAPTPEPHGRDE